MKVNCLILHYMINGAKPYTIPPSNIKYGDLGKAFYDKLGVKNGDGSKYFPNIQTNC